MLQSSWTQLAAIHEAAVNILPVSRNVSRYALLLACYIAQGCQYTTYTKYTQTLSPCDSVMLVQKGSAEGAVTSFDTNETRWRGGRHRRRRG